MTTKKQFFLSLALGCVLLLYILNLNTISNAAIVEGGGERQQQHQAYNEQAYIEGSAVPSQLLRATSNNEREIPPYTPPDQLPNIDPSEWIYLIIHYHKTGHDLSRSLRDFITNSTTLQSNREENAFAIAEKWELLLPVPYQHHIQSENRQHLQLHWNLHCHHCHVYFEAAIGLETASSPGPEGPVRPESFGPGPEGQKVQSVASDWHPQTGH